MQLLVSDIFRNAAAHVPDRPALHIDGDTWTFADLDRISEQLATVLMARGIGVGDHVTHRATICLATVALFAATAKIGAVYVPLDPSLSTDEQSRLEALVLPALSLTEAAGDELLRHASALGEVPPAADDALREDAANILFFTSGSTGAPKCIPITNRVCMLRSHPGAQPESRGAALCPFPLFHVASWTIALQQWQNRAAVILPSTFTAEAICHGITAHRADRIYGIPAIWRRILDHVSSLAEMGEEAPDLSSLKYADTGTSATPPSLIAALRELVPRATIRVFYGSTEAGPVTCLEGSALTEHPDSCGLPLPGVQVRVSADRELELRGPSVFGGHSDQPSSVFTDDGWLRTGDMAEIDPDGFVSITGRVKEVIRSGGHSVVPTEVESTLSALPQIADIAVVGIPDPDWGEIVCAVIVVVPGRDAPDLDSLRSHCAGRLAPFKHPRRLIVVEEIPRTPSTQQIKRHVLVTRISDPAEPTRQHALSPLS